MEKIAIIGGGDLGRLIAYHAIAGGGYSVAGYFDDTMTIGEKIEGIEVIGKLDDIELKFQEKVFDSLIVGIGYNHMKFRKSIFEKFEDKVPFATIIHSSCYVDKSCKIGKGVFLLPGCVLDRNVEIGDNVLLNTGCVIAHDTQIGDHTFLSPAVKIAGKTTVGKSCVIGINSTIIDNIKIGDEVKTGGGTVVIHDLVQPGLYVGIPAKLKKTL